MPFTVVIAGISGRFGRCLAWELLKKPDVVVRGLARDLSKLESGLRSSAALQLTEGDVFDTAVLQKLVKGANVVICTYAGDHQVMIEGQKLLVDACEAEGVPRFFASDYTIDYRKLEYGQLIAKDPMKDVHQYLQGKKVKGVHVLNGVFLDTFWCSWFGAWNPEETSLSFWGTGDEVWEVTSYENAAEFVALLALDETAIGFQKFLGDSLTFNQIADTFEQVHHKKPLLKRLGSLEDLKTRMEAEQKQDPQAVMSWLPLTNGQTSLDLDTSSSPYPELRRISVEDYLRSHTLESLATAMFTVGLKP
ncbi:hypothetical protein ACHAQA_004645 [Verticillium albo-atrum]